MSTFFISSEVFTRSNNLLRSRSFDVSRWLLKPILLKASLSHSKTRVNFNSNCSCCSLQYYSDSDSWRKILLQPFFAFFSDHFPFIFLIRVFSHQQHQSQDDGPQQLSFSCYSCNLSWTPFDQIISADTAQEHQLVCKVFHDPDAFCNEITDKADWEPFGGEITSKVKGSAVAVISSDVSVSVATFVFFRDLPNS